MVTEPSSKYGFISALPSSGCSARVWKPPAVGFLPLPGRATSTSAHEPLFGAVRFRRGVRRLPFDPRSWRGLSRTAHHLTDRSAVLEVAKAGVDVSFDGREAYVYSFLAYDPTLGAS